MAEQRVWHQASVRELPAVLLTAGRLLRDHWPAFLVLACLGVAARNAALWAAVLVSDWNGLVAQVLLVVAPLGYLLPIIAMLHLSRRSLDDGALPLARGGLLGIAAAVLVPFLTVYIANGLLDADRDEFLNAAAFAEFDQNFGRRDADYDYAGRLGYYPFLVVATIVVVAFVVRWALGRFQQRWHFVGLAALAAFVEVYWTGIVSRYADYSETQVTHWLDQRRASHVVLQTYDDATATLGSFEDPVKRVVSWLFDLVGAFDAVVIVPLAWLVVAAVVLGHEIMPPASKEHPWLQRLTVIPRPIRVVLAKVTEELRDRWSAFWQGLKMLGAAGLLPMLAFSIAFLLALRAGWFVGEVARFVVGPTQTTTFLAIQPWEDAIAMAVSMVTIGPLLAAAAHWLISASQARPDEGTSARLEGSPTPA